MGSLAVGSDQDHVWLVLFDVNRQVFVADEISELLIVVDLYVEGKLSLSAFVDKGNSELCIFQDHRQDPNRFSLFKTGAFVELQS